ncbi:S1 family peptidase [Nitrosococcus wardiae]|nr:serine protease [Nitrosococcus wardiae]
MFLPEAEILADLPDTINRVKHAVVGIGTYTPTHQSQASYRGTGFMVADGRHVVTNAHVLPSSLNAKRREHIAVFVGIQGKVRRAEKVVVDHKHDLALLKIDGASLPAFSLGNASRVREGDLVAFTGFPIGPVLGLYPVTHRGIVAAITPIASAGRVLRDLNPQRIQHLRSEPFKVFQLDATAYPGNSGSPVYDPDTGKLLGVVNMVFVKESKENILKDPSGITYAIPVDHLRTLLSRAGLKP